MTDENLDTTSLKDEKEEVVEVEAEAETKTAERRALRTKNKVNYNEEALIDWSAIALDGDYKSSPPSKRARTDGSDDMPKATRIKYSHDVRDANLEEETAWAVGFNGLSISEEEEELLPAGADESLYSKVPIVVFCHLNDLSLKRSSWLYRATKF